MYRGYIAHDAYVVFVCCLYAELELTPSREWPGKGLLGVTIRFDSYEGAEDQLLHVLVRSSVSIYEQLAMRTSH